MNNTIAMITQKIAQSALLRSSAPIVGPIELNRRSSILTVPPEDTALIKSCRSGSVRLLVRTMIPSSPVGCTCVPAQFNLSKFALISSIFGRPSGNPVSRREPPVNSMLKFHGRNTTIDTTERSISSPERRKKNFLLLMINMIVELFNAATEEELHRPRMAAGTERIEERPGHRNGGKHRHQDAEAERERKSFDERRAKPKKNDC